jgi:hypothetical protein
MPESEYFIELNAFIKEHCNVKVLPLLDADLFESLALAGDDVDEFLLEFSYRFQIDLRNYLWYFHQEEEPTLNFVIWFIKSPDKRVQRIPVIISILREAMRIKAWPVLYPEHTLPTHRWDTIINRTIIGIPLLVLFIIALPKGIKWFFTLF